MEASTQRQPYRRAARNGPRAAERVGRGFVEPVRSMLTEAGEIAAFAGRAFVELPGSLRYFAEMLRQVAILITGSAIVLWAMQFTFGLTRGPEAGYIPRGYRASRYARGFRAPWPIPEAAPVLFA